MTDVRPVEAQKETAANEAAREAAANMMECVHQTEPAILNADGSVSQGPWDWDTLYPKVRTSEEFIGQRRVDRSNGETVIYLNLDGNFYTDIRNPDLQHPDKHLIMKNLNVADVAHFFADGVRWIF